MTEPKTLTEKVAVEQERALRAIMNGSVLPLDPPPEQSAHDPLVDRIRLAARAYMLAYQDAEGTKPLAVRLEIAERVARLALQEV